jgi:hypothetical protein
MDSDAARRYTVNRRLIAETLERDEFRTSGRRYVWLGLSVVKSAAIFYVGISIIPAALDGELGKAFTFSGRGLLRNLVIPILAAVAMTFTHAWFLFRGAAAEPEVIARRIEREWAKLTSAGWIGRTLLRGLWMGLVIGLSVGAFMAFGPVEIPDLPQQPLVAIASFTGLTLLWTLPMAFLLRWVVKRHYMRLGQSPGVA